MLGVLALLLLLLPVVELYLIVQVAQGIGTLETVALLILIAVVGVWLVRLEGLGVLARMQSELDTGQVPTTTLLDGALILAAGVLLVVPGFVTDVVGVLLLLPPTRALVRRLLARRYRSRIRSGVVAGPGRFRRFGQVIVVDGTATERQRPGPVDDAPGPARELPRPDEP
jgi:UPF0716 protein FxsA